MKRLIIICVTILLAIGASAVEAKTLRIRLDTHMASSDHISKAYDKFAESVKEVSNGQVQATVFYANQLGSDAENFEMTRVGFIEAATGSYANFAMVSSIFEALHLPFIFQSREQFLRAMSSPKVIDRINQDLASKNLIYVGHFEFGFRQIGTTKNAGRVVKIEDMKNKKLRTSFSPLEIATVNALGGMGTPLPWTETPDAARMGVVDGMTIPFDSFWSSKIYEVVRHIGQLDFEKYSDIFLFSKKWWDNLNAQQREWIKAAVKEAEEWHRREFVKLENEYIEDMKGKGVDIYKYDAAEKKRFQERAKVVWKDFDSTTCPKEWVDLIVKEAGLP